MRNGRYALTTLFAAFLLVAAACQPAPRETPAVEGQPGGTLVFAAEQYPRCLNPITSCYNASWMHWIATLEVLPQLLIFDYDNNYATGIATEIPSIEAGTVTEEPFSVTYEIEEDAVWEDGTPITGEDVRFTWQAIMQSAQSLFSGGPGYDKITEIAVDASNNKSFTIRFSEPFAPWKDLFGGGLYILKAAAFGGNPEISDRMQSDLAGMCGSAWCLESFTESELVLVRNERYWKEKAFLDRIVFRHIPEQPAEINAFRTGEIHAFFPQPTTELVDQIGATPGGEITVKGGTVFQGIWFNMDRPPLDDVAVREALLLGLDRKAPIDTIVAPVWPEVEVNHCLWNVPFIAGGKWCPEVFETEPDVAAANQILDDAGWVRGADGIRAKGGQRLTIPWATTAGNVGREQFQQIIIAQAKELGIEITTDNSDATTLFQTRLPARTFTMFLAAQAATPDPSIFSVLHSSQIPTADSPAGQNYYGWRNAQADRLMEEADREVDEERRVEIFEQINELMRQDVISIPLHALPQIVVYNSAKLGGEFDFNAGQAAFAHALKTWFFLNAEDRT